MRSWLSKLITNHHLAAKGGVEFRTSPLACLIAFQTTTSGSVDTQNGSLSSSSPSASAGLRTMHSWLLEMGGLQLRGGNSASGPASVGKDLIVPRGWAPSWTGVAAARAAPGRSDSRAMRETSVTPTRACTATSQLTSRDTRSECVHVSGSHLFLN